ncbi:MAG: hypothetical protein M1816_003339, partial [Peltula sp. TS41687]
MSFSDGRPKYIGQMQSPQGDAVPVEMDAGVLAKNGNDMTELTLSKGEDTAKDVLRENGALRALKESNARNINVIYDAFFLASYVWIVSEYRPG